MLSLDVFVEYHLDCISTLALKFFFSEKTDKRLLFANERIHKKSQESEIAVDGMAYLEREREKEREREVPAFWSKFSSFGKCSSSPSSFTHTSVCVHMFMCSYVYVLFFYFDENVTLLFGGEDWKRSFLFEIVTFLFFRLTNLTLMFSSLSLSHPVVKETILFVRERNLKCLCVQDLYCWCGECVFVCVSTILSIQCNGNFISNLDLVHMQRSPDLTRTRKKRNGKRNEYEREREREEKDSSRKTKEKKEREMKERNGEGESGCSQGRCRVHGSSGTQGRVSTLLLSFLKWMYRILVCFPLLFCFLLLFFFFFLPSQFLSFFLSDLSHYNTTYSSISYNTLYSPYDEESLAGSFSFSLSYLSLLFIVCYFSSWNFTQQTFLFFFFFFLSLPFFCMYS